MTLTFIEVGGSLLILAAFAATQLGRLDAHSPTYLMLNAAGSTVLAVIALVHSSWGFLLLEATWAVVSTVALAAGRWRLWRETPHPGATFPRDRGE
jgi:hypothetical protein